MPPAVTHLHVTHLHAMHHRVMHLHVMRHHVMHPPVMPRRKCAPTSSTRAGEIFVISPFLNEIISNTP